MSLETQLEKTAAREAAYRTLNNDAMGWLRDFALDEEDIDSAAFLDELEALLARLREMDESELPPQPLSRYTAFIPAFIRRQQQHIKERDAELRDIVSVLTKAVVGMISRNDVYNSTMREQIDSITALSRLEDIRKLRSGLIAELGQLRDLQQKKEGEDNSSVQNLTGQVESLRSELQVAQEESRRDGLTRTFNRRAFDAQVESLVDAGGSRRNPFALLMLDLDSFKEINDHFGHPVGDRVLLGLVEICRGVIRGEDFFARYGGDEFAIIFPGASARVVARKGREICQIVSSRVFTLEAECDQKAIHLSLSVSVGVTEFKSGDNATELMKRADAALYKAKRDGKNCVRVG